MAITFLGDSSAVYLENVLPSFRNVLPMLLIKQRGTMAELSHLASQIPTEVSGVILKASFTEFMRHLKYLKRHPLKYSQENNHYSTKLLRITQCSFS